MNAEQRVELLDKIADLAGEHCQAFVFIAQVPSDEAEAEEDFETHTISNYNGGANLVLGLLKRTEARLLRAMFNDD